MKTLVCGGAGYIGSACVEALIQQEHEVLVIDNLSEGHRAAVHPKAKFSKACLSDREKVFALLSDFSPEIVIHFAACALVGESMTNPSRYFTNNVTSGLHLLDACVESGVRKIVFSSTCATYGIPKTIPISENAPQNPINPYGESKLIFEKCLRWYREIHGLSYVAFRYFNACGATANFGEHHRNETHLIPNLLKVALGQKSACPIFGTDYPTADGTCIRDYIHISDLARAHILAAQSETSGCFNLGTGKGYSVREVISACQMVSGKLIKTIDKPRRLGDPPKLIAVANLAKEVFGWAPRFSIEAIAQSAWHWHKQHPHGYPD